MNRFSGDFAPSCSQHVPGFCSRTHTRTILLSLKRSGHCATKHLSSDYPKFIPNTRHHNLSFHLVVHFTYGMMTASCSRRLNSKRIQSSPLLIQWIVQWYPRIGSTESRGYAIYQLKGRDSITIASSTISIQHEKNCLCPPISIVLNWLHTSCSIAPAISSARPFDIEA